MNRVGIIRYREDIEQYIRDKGRVSKKDIYDIFFDKRDMERFELEIDIMVDKLRKASKLNKQKGLVNGIGYIDVVDGYFVYVIG